jgi:RimJ/RimL family protein N-acetyltransferase
MTTLETERLILRLFHELDLDAYAELCADLEVMRYIGSGQPLSRDEAWRSMATMLGHWQLRGFGLWAVEEKATQAMIGRIGCWQPEGWPDFEIGWVLQRSYWGKGFALEAAQASVKYAFEDLGRSHIISLIDPDNQRSIAVAKRLGETLEGQAEILGRPVLVYGLYRQDWLKR